MTWAVVLSDIPIVLSMYLLIVIAKLYFQTGLIVPAGQGLWYVHCDGTVKTGFRMTQLRSVDLSTLPFKTTVELESGERVTIWRDSCSDKQYRQFILVLRQWQIKQGAKAPC